jgi:hypothetical protein
MTDQKKKIEVTKKPTREQQIAAADNARLIAAAPTMFELLRECYGELRGLASSNDSDYARPDDELLAMLREFFTSMLKDAPDA